MADNIDLGLGLEGTVVIVTGAGGQIGRTVVESFLKAGSFVVGFDINEVQFSYQHERLLWQKVDITDEKQIANGFEHARTHFGPAMVLVAAAGLDLSFVQHHVSAIDLSAEQFRRTMEVVSIEDSISA